MHRLLALVLVQLRMDLLAAMQYRLGFFSQGVLGLGWSLLGVVPLFVALEHRESVATWSPWQLVVLTGSFTVVQGIFGLALQPSLLATMERIRTGTLDYVLLRPADGLFLCAFSKFAPWRGVEIAGGLAIIALGLAREGVSPTLGDVARAAFAFSCGIGALYGLGILSLCASFRALRLDNLTFFLEAVLDFGRWPSGVFGGGLRVVFTFVVPLAIMTTLPAEVVLGRPTNVSLLTAFAVAVGFLLAAKAAWTWAIRQYTSASS